MGERIQYQPLTRYDKTTVVLYRTGIALCALLVAGMAAFFIRQPQQGALANTFLTLLICAFYAAIGLSVFFIHLYAGAFHRFLKRLYFLALVALLALFYATDGNVAVVAGAGTIQLCLFLPLVGCLSFVTAKEAFCFRLNEGFLLAMMMPLCLLSFALGGIGAQSGLYGLGLIAALLTLFTLRKVFQPLHYDIGDKSAYE